MTFRSSSPILARLLAVISTTALAACLDSGGDTERTPSSLTLRQIGGYTHEGGTAAAEIPSYDAASKRLFVVNGSLGTVDVLALDDPSKPAKVGTIHAATLGAGLGAVNSVAVHDGLVAVAVEAAPKTGLGKVALINAVDLKVLTVLDVGAQPDMLVFTPDGRKLLVANEGEPNSYGQADSIDPEGSVSVITVNRGGTPSVATADFRVWNGQEAALRAQGVRIFGPGANAAQDLEPEYIAISADGATAWITLQENNAVAVIDVANAKVTAIKALGTKDHNLVGMGMDASDEDGGIDTNGGTPAVKIAQVPVKGMYLPDGIASFTTNGQTYLITANEGDARADWPGFIEETRVRAHCAAGLDPTVFGADAARLLFDSALGRLRVTNTPNAGESGKNGQGQCNALYSFGARSFSIWDTALNRVFDSGDQFEQQTRALANANFNAGHDNNTLDSRSPAKGPEPESVVVAAFGKKTFAFIGLERIGGVMVYDVSTPQAARFTTYLNPRTADAGDRGPEGLTFVPADKSPNGKPLLIVGNEVSGTTGILQIDLGY